MYCSNCGNKLTEKSGFCENCGAGNRSEPAAKSQKISALGLTAIITSVIVIISCTASWFLFFAEPAAGAATGTTRQEDPALVENTRKPDSSTREPSTVVASTPESSAQTSSERIETPPASSIGQPIYDAVEKPVFEDFLWYTQDVYENGKPEQVIPLEFSDLQGKWKALLWYDPQNMMDAEGWDSLIIDLGGNADNVLLKLHWHESYIKSTDSIVDMSALAYSEMVGLYNIEGIRAGNPGYELYLTDFYLLGEHQYAFGYMLVASGEDVFVALVRP